MATTTLAGLTRNAFIDTAPFTGTDEDDTITAPSSDDNLSGGGGDDVLFGNAGNDTILGGPGDDMLNGGDGSDVLIADAGEDMLNGGAAMDMFTGTAAGFDGDMISNFDFGDQIEITGLNDDSIVTITNGSFEVDVDGDGTAEATFMVSASGVEFTETQGTTAGSRLYALDTTNAPTPGIGASVEGVTDFGTIANFLFSDPDLVPTSISYVGAYESIALLADGHSISQIVTDPDNPDAEPTLTEVVGIDRGIFLSSGGGPGTENTSTSFRVSLGEPGDARLTATAQEAFSGAGSTNDASIVTFTFDAADLGNAPSIQFDLFFGSDEYPEFVNSQFVDIAAVYVNGVNYALFNNDPAQPLAIVGDSINTAGNFFNNNTNTNSFNTEYDGFSVLLNVLAPIQEGINTVVIGIADTGDTIYDSGLFVGNVRGSNFNSSGSFVRVDGTTGDDEIAVNNAPQLVELGGGADTVTGTASGFDGDVIEGFGDDDVLEFQEASFGAEDVTITMGSAILDIDSDGDGEADTTVTLEGNFTEAEFAFDTVDGTTSFSATGVLIDGMMLTGTDEAETLTGADGDDTINGLAGDDLLQGNGGDDFMDGGAGDDGLQGGAGDDTMNGGAGDDNLAASDGDDVVNGDAGDDLMGGGLGNDTMDGGADNDFMGGGQGDDSMVGGAGNDVVNGGAGNDNLDGAEGNDIIGASVGSDTVSGGAGNDNIGGGAGADSIDAGAGDDSVGGGESNDTIDGGAGDDFLAGGGRDDVIDGGVGDDVINAGNGDDTMTGGAGDDVFVFTGFNDGDADVITDWTDGEDSFRMTGIENAPGSGLAGKLAALNIIDTADGAQMTYQGHVILLEGVDAADLGLEDFSFL